MEVRWIGPAGVEAHREEDLPSLLGREGVVYFPPGTVWQDPFPAGGSSGSPIWASLGVIEAALLHE